MLQVRNLKKSYPTPQGSLQVLDGIDLDLNAGQSLALMGESGSGKSTLLHLISGLDAPDSGSILFQNNEISNYSDSQRAELRRSYISVVFQQFNLISSLTVGANLAFQARLAGKHDVAWQAQLTEALGLSDMLDRYPEQLSGGQQQRVAIGRTLAARPALILADEPTGNLDEETGNNVLDLTLNLVRDMGCAFLMVTHSSKLAKRLDNTVVLTKGLIAK
ncbi:MAG: ABC transporter ATP-binding protein [Hyphomicrobiales bacterium]|nr:ABC transporter ATP-binding protein [Hyphomicrobiales bacterium]PCJ89474.1 MAG: ABC transporter ATP-binding protein [Hyphomicrobiales bacterium]